MEETNKAVEKDLMRKKLTIQGDLHVSDNIIAACDDDDAIDADIFVKGEVYIYRTAVPAKGMLFEGDLKITGDIIADNFIIED